MQEAAFAIRVSPCPSGAQLVPRGAHPLLCRFACCAADQVNHWLLSHDNVWRVQQDEGSIAAASTQQEEVSETDQLSLQLTTSGCCLSLWAVSV